jgi:hypothetical protein
MAVYDIHIKRPAGTVVVLKSSAGNPDDAIHRLSVAGDFDHEAGDVVTLCVDVERKVRRTS